MGTIGADQITCGFTAGFRPPLLRSESHRDYQSTDAVGNFARGKIRVTRGIAFDKLFVTTE
ncbi:MAG: hypothetical protein R3C17_20305 [Planctomycetaceae bacterium]